MSQHLQDKATQPRISDEGISTVVGAFDDTMPVAPDNTRQDYHAAQDAQQGRSIENELLDIIVFMDDA